MDAKSLAKSKRAHSQHLNKKHHLKPTSKSPPVGTVGATSSQKPTGKQIREKYRQSQGSKALPSNWDRYLDEYDSESENPSQGSTSQLTDNIVPKSKGADYTHLISEAKSKAQADYSTESFPSFDDVFTDFNQGVGSLLSVRGQSILSRIEDDNFVVGDKATGGQEASFLSMDLNALAEQLAKVDISKRLFIEEDLLPPELYTGEIQSSIEQESFKEEVTSRSKAAKEGSSELSGGAKQNDRYIEVNESITIDHPVPKFTGVGSGPMSQVKDEPWKSRTDESSRPESRDQSSVKATAIQNNRHSRFEAADAELELDILLNSFSEPKILRSSDQLVSTPMKKGPDLPKSALAADLDDSLDDLLRETSSQINQKVASRSQEVKASSLDVLPSPSLGPTSKSKLSDDFDSWLDTF